VLNTERATQKSSRNKNNDTHKDTLKKSRSGKAVAEKYTITNEIIVSDTQKEYENNLRNMNALTLLNYQNDGTNIT
jgi:hypothetical protein